MNNVYLVGFMGTGKTVVGFELSRRLNRAFFDLDELIEKKEQRKISDIFAKDGEPYFRSVEKDVLYEVSLLNNIIVSCGGGIVLVEDNVKAMKATGVIICLAAEPEAILKRTERTAHRPLLNTENPRQIIEELLKKRLPFYAKADYTIETSALGISDVVNKIIKDILPR